MGMACRHAAGLCIGSCIRHRFRRKSKLVRGAEGALWAELLDHPDRIAEYQAYPRLCALAEVGWSRPEVRDWNDFMSA
ncbi:MAG: family 20 glycosylhydrolase [Alistipes indistinctus]